MADPRDAGGFTLTELLIAVAVMTVTAAIAIPAIETGMRRYALNNAAQQIASTIRSARYTAVSKNKKVRVRFNCPDTDQYRVVEVVNSNTVDQATDRCSNTSYPYPDAVPGTAPDVDGPILLLPTGTEMAVVEDLEIDTDGRVTAQTGCPTCAPAGGTVAIAIENGFESQTINVSNQGQVDVDGAVPIDE